MDGWISLMACHSVIMSKLKQKEPSHFVVLWLIGIMHYMYICTCNFIYIYILPLFPRENYMPTLGLAAYADPLNPPRSDLEACDRFDLPEDLTANIERCGYNVPTPVQKCLGCCFGMGLVGVGWLGLEEMGWGKQKRMVSFGGKMMELLGTSKNSLFW